MAIISFFLPNTDNSYYVQDPATQGGGRGFTKPVSNQQLRKWWKLLTLGPPQPSCTLLKKFNSHLTECIFQLTHGDLWTLVVMSVQGWHEAWWQGDGTPSWADHVLCTIYPLSHLPSPTPTALDAGQTCAFHISREEPNWQGRCDTTDKEQKFRPNSSQTVYLWTCNVHWKCVFKTI